MGCSRCNESSNRGHESSNRGHESNESCNRNRNVHIRASFNREDFCEAVRGCRRHHNNESSGCESNNNRCRRNRCCRCRRCCGFNWGW